MNWILLPNGLPKVFYFGGFLAWHNCTFSMSAKVHTVWACTKKISSLEMPGIEPGAFHMQSERATTALHPLLVTNVKFFEDFYSCVNCYLSVMKRLLVENVNCNHCLKLLFAESIAGNFFFFSFSTSYVMYQVSALERFQADLWRIHIFYKKLIMASGFIYILHAHKEACTEVPWLFFISPILTTHNFHCTSEMWFWF